MNTFGLYQPEQGPQNYEVVAYGPHVSNNGGVLRPVVESSLSPVALLQ